MCLKIKLILRPEPFISWHITWVCDVHDVVPQRVEPTIAVGVPSNMLNAVPMTVKLPPAERALFTPLKYEATGAS